MENIISSEPPTHISNKSSIIKEVPTRFIGTVYRSNRTHELHLQRCKRGTFGPGIYFYPDRESALVHDGYIQASLIELNNPWLVAADWDSPMARHFDFESPCVEAILELPNGRTMLDKSYSTDGHYGDELLETLTTLGHDGIVATYSDGCQEIAAFHRDQIKKAWLEF